LQSSTRRRRTPSSAEGAHGGDGVDHAFHATGIEATLHTAIRLAGKGGSVTIISICETPATIDPNEIVLAALS
jgi:threonine dehydrogenase-like Zn-dependent dehydrogenase